MLQIKYYTRFLILFIFYSSCTITDLTVCSVNGIDTCIQIPIKINIHLEKEFREFQLYTLRNQYVMMIAKNDSNAFYTYNNYLDDARDHLIKYLQDNDKFSELDLYYKYLARAYIIKNNLHKKTKKEFNDYIDNKIFRYSWKKRIEWFKTNFTNLILAVVSVVTLILTFHLTPKFNFNILCRIKEKINNCHSKILNRIKCIYYNITVIFTKQKKTNN